MFALWMIFNWAAGELQPLTGGFHRRAEVPGKASFLLHLPSLHHSSNKTREESLHGHHQMANTEIRLIFAAKDGEALYSQQKQDQELTVAQTMNSLLPNSD